MSLPSWECGLKFSEREPLLQELKSLPSWECGLKSKLCKGDVMVAEVTPFVGVWIEIQKHEIGTQAKDDTPFMK